MAHFKMILNQPEFFFCSVFLYVSLVTQCLDSNSELSRLIDHKSYCRLLSSLTMPLSVPLHLDLISFLLLDHGQRQKPPKNKAAVKKKKKRDYRRIIPCILPQNAPCLVCRFCHLHRFKIRLSVMAVFFFVCRHGMAAIIHL